MNWLGAVLVGVLVAPVFAIACRRSPKPSTETQAALSASATVADLPRRDDAVKLEAEQRAEFEKAQADRAACQLGANDACVRLTQRCEQLTGGNASYRTPLPSLPEARDLCRNVSRYLATEQARPKRTVAELQAACDGGDKTACSNLEFIYAEGRGVPRDPARALAIHDSSHARAGQGASGCNAGADCAFFYDLGNVVDGRNEQRRAAIDPKTVARECAAGRREACDGLAAASPSDPAKAKKYKLLANAILRRECDGKLRDSCQMLGLRLLEEPASREQGRALLDPICRAGSYRICEQVEGKMRAEPAVAAEYVTLKLRAADLACTARDVLACMLAAFAYERGLGVPKNPELAKAYKYKQQAIEGDNAVQRELGKQSQKP